MGSEPAARAVVIVVHGPAGPAGAYSCDVRDLAVADERSLDALARLQMTARRLGSSIRLQNASPALVDLIDLAGLAEVLVVD